MRSKTFKRKQLYFSLTSILSFPLLMSVFISVAHAPWSTLGTGYATTSNYHGVDVPPGTPVTVTAGTLDSHVTHITFRWHMPNDTVRWEVTVLVFTNGTTGQWNNGTTALVRFAQDTQVPDVLGDWRVQAFFQDNTGLDRADLIELIMIRSASFAQDIAIAAITLEKTIVGEEYPLGINVTIQNEGDNQEACNVTIYGNTTVITVIPNVALPPGNTSVLTLIWDTASFAYGNYTINATITILPGETDTADNTLVDGWIFVTIPGDVDGDHDVDLFDLVRMAVVYGVSKPDPRYNPNCDINGDGDIDILDIVIAAGHYGESW